MDQDSDTPTLGAEVELDKAFSTLEELTQFILETADEDYSKNLEMTADAARQASQAYLRKAKKFELLAQKLEKEHDRHLNQSSQKNDESQGINQTEIKW